MTVYSYSRVSTARQASEGESLDVQQRTIAGYAMMHGLSDVQAFVERGVSGSVPLTDRPQGKALLATLKSGDVVITAKLDRMFPIRPRCAGRAERSEGAESQPAHDRPRRRRDG